MPAPEPKWHPIMAAVEPEPGTWYMVTPKSEYSDETSCYGVIRIVRSGGQVGYRADTWAADPADRVLIGRYLSLRGAAAAVHSHYLSGHTPKGWPNQNARNVPGYANTPDRMERD